MKGKMKLIFTVFCFILLGGLSLFGCYKENFEYERIDPGTLKSPTVPWGSPNFRDYYGTLTKYEKPVKITVGAIQYELEAGVKPGTTLENQTFNQIAKDVLNIDLVYTTQAVSTAYDTKLNLDIAGGRMPDMFYTTSPTLFASLMKNNNLADLSDAFWHLNDELIENYLTYMPELLPTVMKDSKLYALPMPTNKYVAAQNLYVRKDWLDLLGLKMPDSIESFKEVAKAFKDNEKIIKDEYSLSRDIIPFTMHKNLVASNSYSAAGLFNAHGAKLGAYFEGSDGKLYASSTSPEAKAALATMNEMYAYKSLDNEFLSRSPESIVSQINSGYVGMVFGEWWIPKDSLDTCITNVSGADWAFTNLGQPIIDRVYVTGYNLVSKNCSNPEAVAKLINLFYDIYYNDDSPERYKDRLGNALVLPANGFYHQFVPVKLWDGVSSIREYKRVRDVFQGLYDAGLYKTERLTGGLYQSIASSALQPGDFQIGSAGNNNINVINRDIINAIKNNAVWNDLFFQMRNREKVLHFADGYPYFVAYKQGVSIKNMTPQERRGWGIYHQMISPDGLYAYITKLSEDTDGKYPVKYNEFYGPPITSMLEYDEYLSTQVNKTFTDIIRGEEKQLSYFDTFRDKDYNVNGGATIQKQINQWWNAHKN